MNSHFKILIHRSFLLTLVICMAFACALILGMATSSQSLAESKKSKPPENARQIIKVPAQNKYRAVYDIHDNTIAAGINRGLYYARGLVEAFEKQGVKPEQLDIHLVLHGNAAKSLLIDDAYQMASDDPFAVNPNDKVVKELIALGVNIEICHSTMKSKGWVENDVLPGVKIVHDGYTRLIKLQNDGYAYIGGF